MAVFKEVTDGESRGPDLPMTFFFSYSLVCITINYNRFNRVAVLDYVFKI